MISYLVYHRGWKYICDRDRVWWSGLTGSSPDEASSLPTSRPTHTEITTHLLNDALNTFLLMVISRVGYMFIVKKPLLSDGVGLRMIAHHMDNYPKTL